MSYLKLALVGLIAGVACIPVNAGPVCQAPVYHAPAYVAPVEHKVLAVFLPHVSYLSGLDLPAYLADLKRDGFASSKAAPNNPTPAVADKTAEILDTLKAINARLDVLENKRATVSGEQLFVSKCGRCHESGVADDMGEGHILVTDSKVVLSDAMRAKSIAQVENKTMPKGKTKLSYDEEKVLLSYLKGKV